MKYTLGTKIQSGGEGVVYTVQGRQDLVVKVYHSKDIDGNIIKTLELYEKLQWMVKNPPQNRLLIEQGILAWPIDIYYSNSTLEDFKSFQGFVMPRLVYDISLDDAFAYKHPVIDEHRGYDKYLSVEARIEVAIQLCTIFIQLQKNGFVIGDFNKDNIGVRLFDRQIVIMDCDSFHLVKQLGNEKYRCTHAMGGYVAPEIIEYCDDEKASGRNYTIDKVRIIPDQFETFTEYSDNFCLAVHLFHLLMNGVSPYNGINQGIHGSTNRPFVENDAIKRNEYVFRQGKEPNAEFCLPQYALPDVIAQYFDLAFITGRRQPAKRPTAEEWRSELVRYHDNLTNCRDYLKHQYFSKFKVCPYCIADARYEEKQKNELITPYPPTFTKALPKQQPIHQPSSGIRIALVVASVCVLFLVSSALGRWYSRYHNIGLRSVNSFMQSTSTQSATMPISNQSESVYAGNTEAVVQSQQETKSVSTQPPSSQSEYERVIQPDGSWHEGEWVDGKPHGVGKTSWPDRGWQEGEFENGAFIKGKVFYIYDNGTYEGDWSNDGFNGTGKFIWSDGRWYEGEFLNNFIHGTGRVFFPDGSWHEGEFKHGDFISGKVFYLYNSGNKYEGNWSNGFPNGTGKYTFSDGSWFEGEFLNGERWNGIGLFADGLGQEYKVIDGITSLIPVSEFVGLKPAH